MTNSIKEPTFADLIAECRSTFGRYRFLHCFGLKGGLERELRKSHASLEPIYQLLAQGGRVVWGAVAQVNYAIFDEGSVDVPGVTIYSVDSYYDSRPQDLVAIAKACFHLKNTSPVDPELRSIANRMTDECDETIRMPVPRCLSDGREVMIGATIFHRSRLPGRTLQAGALPMVVLPKITDVNMILSLPCWSKTLIKNWETLNSWLKLSPVASTALEVAQFADKQTLLEYQCPDWDVEHVPIKLTKAMAEFLFSVFKEHKFGDAPPMLFVCLEGERRLVNFIGDLDQDTQISFRSSDVVVVIRKDQIEQLSGTILDYKSSVLGSGIVVRLPND